MGRIPKVEKEKALVAFYQGGADYSNVELKVQQTGAGTYDFHLDPKSESGERNHNKLHRNNSNDEDGFHMFYDGQSSEGSVEIKKEPGDFLDFPINDCEFRNEHNTYTPHGSLPSTSAYPKPSHLMEAMVTSDSLDRSDRSTINII